MSETAIRTRHGASIGEGRARADARLKVTGRAPFAADRRPAGLLHGVMAVSPVARGRLVSLDLAAARAHPGVVEVMTHANAPALAMSPDEKSHGFAFKLDLLQNDRIRYPGQPIAVVLAETLEAATEGAALLAPVIEPEPARTGLDADTVYAPEVVGAGQPANEHKGDVATALAAAPVRVAATYETAAQYHNPMETHCVVAAWDGDTLELDMPTQGMAIAQARLAELFGIAAENIHIRTPFLGGGFGSKGLVMSPQVLGIMAAKLAGRPVKLVTAREQMFGPVGHRGQTRQTIALGADADGRLRAIDHRTRAATSTHDEFIESAGGISHTLYAADAISTSHEGVRLDIGTPIFMRAPGEATGSAALEAAIDEMAEACGLDPLEFRLRNYAETEPMTGKPFSSKALRECYAAGAARFGWSGRPRAPRQMRDADGMLVGWGWVPPRSRR